MSQDDSQRLAAIGPFSELLFIAGSAAANPESAWHRATAVRDAERLGLDWTEALSNDRANFVEAIVALVKTLAGATTPAARVAVARSIRELVTAARAMPVAPQPARLRHGEPRRYWIENEN